MTARTMARGVRRLFEGWAAGMIILLIAGSSIVLALPRAVAPEALPAPAIDGASLRRTMAEDDARARAASENRLDVDVRAVGRELRAYNRAAASGDEAGLLQARAALARAAQRALVHGDEPLLVLRAFQMTRFVMEARSWQASGAASEELTELGGDFVATAERSHWFAIAPVELDERVLRVLFKKRWNDLSGLRGPAFDLTLDEDRVRYGFLLAHPFRAATDRALGEQSPGLAELLDQQQRMRLLDRLFERDDRYPVELARGILLFRLGRYPLASEAFRRHLEAQPDGPYTLRARNHLKAALDRSREDF